MNELAKFIDVQGYQPNVDSVSSSIKDEKKKQSLNAHSEKLAVAFGLISSVEGSLIKIVESLICLKLISKIVNREMVLRHSSTIFTKGCALAKIAGDVKGANKHHDIYFACRSFMHTAH